MSWFGCWRIGRGMTALRCPLQTRAQRMGGEGASLNQCNSLPTPTGASTLLRRHSPSRHTHVCVLGGGVRARWGDVCLCVQGHVDCATTGRLTAGPSTNERMSIRAAVPTSTTDALEMQCAPVMMSTSSSSCTAACTATVGLTAGKRMITVTLVCMHGRLVVVLNESVELVLRRLQQTELLRPTRTALRLQQLQKRDAWILSRLLMHYMEYQPKLAQLVNPGPPGSPHSAPTSTSALPITHPTNLPPP